MEQQSFSFLNIMSGNPRNKGKKTWSSDEDAQLLRLVELHGGVNWALIAQGLTDRTGKQCRERYHNHLRPSVRKGDWTPEEDELIVRMQAELGNQWARITKMLPGRTDNAVKNRWHAAVRSMSKGSKISPCVTVPGMGSNKQTSKVSPSESSFGSYSKSVSPIAPVPILPMYGIIKTEKMHTIVPLNSMGNVPYDHSHHHTPGSAQSISSSQPEVEIRIPTIVNDANKIDTPRSAFSIVDSCDLGDLGDDLDFGSFNFNDVVDHMKGPETEAFTISPAVFTVSPPLSPKHKKARQNSFENFVTFGIF